MNGATVASFDARLRVPGQARLPLSVVVNVEDDRIAISSGEKPLGDWPLNSVGVEVRSDGFHLTLDNEEILLTVTDPAGFSHALRAHGPEQVNSRPAAKRGAEVVLVESNGSLSRNVLSSRLQGIEPEERFADVIARISELRTALTDDSVAPQEVFSSWLRLLKEINRRHGQSAMPAQLFYKLNTELLEMMPAPSRTHHHKPVVAGATA
jgi:hypothetical protein